LNSESSRLAPVRGPGARCHEQDSRSYTLFGVKVAAAPRDELMRLIFGWAREGRSRVVCFSDAHAIVRAHDDHNMRHALTNADMVAPDGFPVALAGRLLHGRSVERLSGPDMLAMTPTHPAAAGLRHYFYGGAPGVAEQLADRLRRINSDFIVAGIQSPPMRTLTADEAEESFLQIRKARPDMLWVALGAPKQEIWMAKNRDRLPGIVMLGVGAAFDFETGRVRRAPLWMRRIGMEWLFRFLREPQRLGQRYLRVVPRFIYLLLREAVTMRQRRADPAN